MADDVSFKLLFKKDDCRAFWRSIEKNKLEFLLIRGDLSKMCVMDISNNYTRNQLRSLFQLFKDSKNSRQSLPNLLERDSPGVNPQTSQPDETRAEAFQPIALPWYKTDEDTKLERNTARRKYIETFGEEPEFVCEKCFKHFKQKGNLQRHKNTVHGVKEHFTCGTCGARYKHKQHFEDHVKMHDGYMHQCDICLEGFPSRNALRAHKRCCGQETVTIPRGTKRRKEVINPSRATGPLPKFKIPFDCRVAL